MKTFQVLVFLWHVNCKYVDKLETLSLSIFVNWKDHLEYGLGNFVKPHYFLSMLMWIQTVYLNSIFWPKSGFYVFQDQLNQKYGLLGITTKMRRTQKIGFLSHFHLSWTLEVWGLSRNEICPHKVSKESLVYWCHLLYWIVIEIYKSLPSLAF